MRLTKELKFIFDEICVPENEEYSISLFIPSDTKSVCELRMNGVAFIDEYDVPRFEKVLLVATREKLVEFIDLMRAELIQSN